MHEKYIHNILIKHDHPIPLKPQLSLNKDSEIVYGAKVQKVMEEDTHPPLDSARVKHIQALVGVLLYYARVVDNKLLQ